jgi:adenylosuccinate lyase
MFESFKSAVHNRQLKAWEMKRRHGKRFFLYYGGVLRWGGIMFLLTMFTNVFGRHIKLNWQLVVSSLIACPLAGYVWARCIWHVNENRFRDAMKEQDSIKKS